MQTKMPARKMQQPLIHPYGYTIVGSSWCNHDWLKVNCIRGHLHKVPFSVTWAHFESVMLCGGYMAAGSSFTVKRKQQLSQAQAFEFRCVNALLDLY